MSDRYLYKAKRTSTGEWVEGYYVGVRPNLIELQPEARNRIVTMESIIFDVDPSTICQCSGYKGIWERDIFQSDDDRYIIRYDEESLEWMAESVFANDSISLGEFHPEEIDVIGNEIDNPELLEAGE